MSASQPHRRTRSLPKGPDEELYLHRAIDAIPQLIWSALPDGAVDFCNQRWLEYTGLTAEQAQGWGWRAAIHSQDLGKLETVWRRMLAEGVPGEAKARMRRADGIFRWFVIRAMPLRDDQGRIVKWYCANIDVDDHTLAEDLSRKSEERFRLAAEVGKMFAYEWDAATDVVLRSGECAEILGVSETAHLTGRQVLAKVHPDDRATLKASLAGLSPEKPRLQIRYRMIRSDGRVSWVERASRAHFDEHGKMLRIVGLVADITERKLAEGALSNANYRLLEAQEQERTRIARELHDDTSQRLAMLAVEIEQLKKHLSNPSIELLTQVNELWQHTVEIAKGVQALSHELHPPKLEYLGIVAAMKGFCKEFGDQQKISIEFKSHDVPTALPKEKSICLFRVLQEALHNSAKHSGAQQFEVQFWGTPDEIHLTVRDSGAGFKLETALMEPGLGLISMQERVQLMEGTLLIESQPERGTTIHVRVPVRSGSDSLRTVN